MDLFAIEMNYCTIFRHNNTEVNAMEYNTKHKSDLKLIPRHKSFSIPNFKKIFKNASYCHIHRKKRILITGAGSGLGENAVFALASRGHFVYASTHTEEQAQRINTINQKIGLPLKSFKLDVLCDEDRKKIFDLNIDVLINNAAIGDSGSIAEIDVNKYRQTFETNVFCPIELTQLVLKQMIKNGYGRIIFISSLAGRIPIPFLSPYCATKFALEDIAQSLNSELKNLKNVNIPVILIEPGSYATGFNEKNISRQFQNPNSDSYYRHRIYKLKLKQFSYFKLTESINFDSIIDKYIHAVEDEHPKLRYIAPSSQGCYTKFRDIIK